MTTVHSAKKLYDLKLQLLQRMVCALPGPGRCRNKTFGCHEPNTALAQISHTAVPITTCQPLEGADKLLLGCVVPQEAEQMDLVPLGPGRCKCLQHEKSALPPCLALAHGCFLLNGSRGVDFGGGNLSRDISKALGCLFPEQLIMHFETITRS